MPAPILERLSQCAKKFALSELQQRQQFTDRISTQEEIPRKHSPHISFHVNFQPEQQEFQTIDRPADKDAAADPLNSNATLTQKKDSGSASPQPRNQPTVLSEISIKHRNRTALQQQ